MGNFQLFRATVHPSSPHFFLTITLVIFPPLQSLLATFFTQSPLIGHNSASMASQNPNGDVDGSRDNGYTSDDSGYYSDDKSDAEQTRSEDNVNNVIGSQTEDWITSPRRTTPTWLATSTLGIVTRPSSHNLSDVHCTPYDRHIQNVRQILARPDHMAPDQQRYLTRCLDTLYSLRRAAQSTQLPTITEEVPPPVYGPHPRPLSAAAICQNAQARRSRERTAFYARAGHKFPNTPVYKPAPIRYSDAYDDLLGFRSLDDGTPAAYAERDGDEAVHAIRFSRTAHMGLGFGRGHLHMTTEDRRLVEGRQARSLAGLSTEETDEEIAYRVLRDMDSWGWLGRCVGETEWTVRARCYCEGMYCASRRRERSLFV
jgi:hypothetical protein